MSEKRMKRRGLLSSFLSNYGGQTRPPGCASEYIEHPSLGQKGSAEVGFVIEHRFAFCYWLKWKRELLAPPDLVTWDWHDDCGCPEDIIEKQLRSLDQKDEQEIAIYAWAGLRPLNDGHIFPAAWLNAIANVYIVQKQHRDCRRQNHIVEDRSVIGKLGVEVSSGRSEGVPGVMEPISTVAYSWSNDDGSNMIAMFQNDKLIQKAQFGLK
jgi:hypothetical protein